MRVKGQVIIAKDGAITFRTSNGTFERGAPLLASIARLMQQSGVTFTADAVPEQHKHDHDDYEVERLHDHSH